ncbi:hypothetical protein C2W59_01975 [Bacillus pumilus]|nr:hypothetical protein C2W59_01975 [Bacillus pumilus]
MCPDHLYHRKSKHVMPSILAIHSCTLLRYENESCFVRILVPSFLHIGGLLISDEKEKRLHFVK